LLWRHSANAPAASRELIVINTAVGAVRTVTTP
jgi:hypothetical protein